VVAVGKAAFVKAGSTVAVTCATFATGAGGLLQAVTAIADKIATNTRVASFIMSSSVQNGAAGSAPGVPHLASRG
jgi:hypothetical protein